MPAENPLDSADARAEAIERLASVPLEDFVAERTRLARALRKAGDRPGAAEVAKLPKPSAAAWALNHVAREEPAATGEWLAAAQALREASGRTGEGAGDALRGAMAEHRSATSRLLKVVRTQARPGGRPVSEATLDRVRTLLQAATSDAEVADDLQAGRIREEPAAETGPDLAMAPEATLAQQKEEQSLTKASSKAESRTRSGPSSRLPSKAKSETAQRDQRAAERDRRAEEGARRKREELDRRLDEAAEELDRLSEEASRRATAAAAADERLEEGHRALRRLESEAAAAREATTEIDQAVATAQQSVDRLRGRVGRAG